MNSQSPNPAMVTPNTVLKLHDYTHGTDCQRCRVLLAPWHHLPQAAAGRPHWTGSCYALRVDRQRLCRQA